MSPNEGEMASQSHLWPAAQRLHLTTKDMLPTAAANKDVSFEGQL